MRREKETRRETGKNEENQPWKWAAKNPFNMQIGRVQKSFIEELFNLNEQIKI